MPITFTSRKQLWTFFCLLAGMGGMAQPAQGWISEPFHFFGLTLGPDRQTRSGRAVAIRFNGDLQKCGFKVGDRVDVIAAVLLPSQICVVLPTVILKNVEVLHLEAVKVVDRNKRSVPKIRCVLGLTPDQALVFKKNHDAWELTVQKAK